jgi:hypothetical protein
MDSIENGGKIRWGARGEQGDLVRLVTKIYVGYIDISRDTGGY